jgi:formyl-CoA transferase
MTAELFDDPQVVADELLVTLDHPVLGAVKMANSPLKMSGGETGSRLPSPSLGQHTREFLAELGYTPDEIAALEASGTVRAWETLAAKE